MAIELSYKRRGQGEPLVLIHGIGHRLEAFDPVFDELAEHYDVIAVDLPGFGQSPGFASGADYSLDALAEAVVANYSRWGIDNPHVVGNSMGGAVSVILGQRGQARSVTALSPAGWFWPWTLLLAGLPLLLMKIGSFAPNAILRLLAGSTIGRKIMGLSLYRYPERLTPERTYGDALSMRRAKGFWPMLLGHIPLAFRVPRIFKGATRVPTTIAWGNRDLILSPRMASKAAASLAGINFVVLDDAGHVPMSDSPDAVIAAINETTALATSVTHKTA